MSRTLVGILVLVAFAAAVVYLAMGELSTRCEVCVVFGGGRVCESAVASNPTDAQQQATSSACAQLTGSVTEVVACTNRAPQSVRCEE